MVLRKGNGGSAQEMWTHEMGADQKLPPPMQSRTVASDGSGELFASARQEAANKSRGQIAPQRAIDALEAAVELPFEDGLMRERAGQQGTQQGDRVGADIVAKQAALSPRSPLRVL